MDKLEQIQRCLSLGKYEEIVSLTKDETEPIYLLYLIAAFISLEKYDEGLLVIEKHHVILEAEFLPSLIDFHIALLKGKKDVVGLMKAKEHYNELPYHSQVVEEKLRSFDDIIKIVVSSMSQKDERMSFENVKRLLETNEVTQCYEGLKYLESYSLEESIDYIKDQLINHPLSIIRSSLVFHLGEHNYDEMVDFKTYQDKIIKINPKIINDKHSRLKNEKYVQRACEYIDKDVSLENIIRTIYTIYELVILPDEIDENDETFFMALAHLAKKYMNIKEEVTSVVSDLADEIDMVTKVYF